MEQQRPVAFRGEFREAALVPELHGQADDVVAFALHETGDDGAIDAAAHGDGEERARHRQGRASGGERRRRRRRR
jgi:hypothetical protein